MLAPARLSAVILHRVGWGLRHVPPWELSRAGTRGRISPLHAAGGDVSGAGVGFALPGMRHVVWSLRWQLGRGRILSPPAAAATCWRHECRWAEETPAGAARPLRPFMGLLSFKAKMSG